MDSSSLSALLFPDNIWFFGTSSKQLISPSIMERVYNKRLHKYLLDRDISRFKRKELPPKWQFFHIPLASSLWQLPHNAATRTMRNRIIFDKHWHPGNEAKKSLTLRFMTSQPNAPYVLPLTLQLTGMSTAPIHARLQYGLKHWHSYVLLSLIQLLNTQNTGTP